MTLQGERTKAWYQRADRVIPHGVNSNFRYWGKEDTLVIQRGQGAYLWDTDDRRYIDYRLGFGPVILGHGYPEVVASVAESIQHGTTFAWTTPLEVQLAEQICRICQVDRVRLTNTGTEATMHALRIARAYTGRERFIKFEGQYHGMADYFMYSTASTHPNAVGSRRSPVPSPATSGIPNAISQYVTCLPYNDFEALERTVAAKWGDLAAIFVEPVLGNLAAIMPEPGFLNRVRELCDRFGIVLVMDEVKTGFRVALGGAQELFNVQADLVTYAKALGNGFPIAAIAGKEEVMMTIEPGAMAHGGTFSGNAVGTAAAVATLKVLESQPVIDTINQRGRALMEGIDEILSEAGIPHALMGPPPMFGLQVGREKPPREFREYEKADHTLYEAIVMELCRLGVLPDVDGREPWFLSFSHSEQDIQETLHRFNDAVKAAKKQI